MWNIYSTVRIWYYCNPLLQYSTLEASVFPFLCFPCVWNEQTLNVCSFQTCLCCEYSQQRLVGEGTLEHICYRSTRFTSSWWICLSCIHVCIVYFTSVEAACQLWLYLIHGCFVIWEDLVVFGESACFIWGCTAMIMLDIIYPHCVCAHECVKLFKSPDEFSYMQACFLYTNSSHMQCPSLYTFLSVTTVIQTPWFYPHTSPQFLHKCIRVC